MTDRKTLKEEELEFPGMPSTTARVAWRQERASHSVHVRKQCGRLA